MDMLYFLFILHIELIDQKIILVKEKCFVIVEPVPNTNYMIFILLTNRPNK